MPEWCATPEWLAFDIVERIRRAFPLDVYSSYVPERGERTRFYEPPWPKAPDTPIFRWDENGVIEDDYDEGDE